MRLHPLGGAARESGYGEMAGSRYLCLHMPCLPADQARGDGALYRLASWAVRFSPLVEAVEPDTLLIDITGCQRLFGGEANIARQAVEGLHRQGFHTRAAIADTVGAACALAFAATEPAAQATGERTPRSRWGLGLAPGDHEHQCIVIVPPGQSAAHLAPLPPAALRIDPQVSARLEALGIRTISDLLRVPRASLPVRFGPQLVRRLQQALGEVFEGVATHEPEEVPHARRSFEQPVCELALLQPVAEQLLADVFEQLRRLDLALRRLECVLYYERTPPMTLSIELSRPSRSAEHTAQLLAQRLEQIDLSGGVCGLMVVARETARWRAGQTDLFEQRDLDQQEQLGCLIDRLAGRLGDGAVVRPQLVDDYQPELAYRYEKKGPGPVFTTAGGLPETPSEQKMDPDPFSPFLMRPVQLFPRPIPIRVIALVPDGPPTWFACGGREYVVVAAEGPERLETAWWRGPDVRRDYFRLTAESGAQFWIFQAFNDRRWYLHGIFA